MSVNGLGGEYKIKGWRRVTITISPKSRKQKWKQSRGWREQLGGG